MDNDLTRSGNRETPEQRITYKNPEGYNDPTPYGALKPMEPTKQDKNALRLIKCLITLIDINGYTLLGRLHLRDRQTGKEYR